MGREFVSEARQTYVPSGLGALDLNSFLAAGWLAKKCISFKSSWIQATVFVCEDEICDCVKHQTLRSKTTMLFGYGSKHRYSKNWMVNTVNSLDGQHLWVLQILILVQSSRCVFPNPAIHVFLGQFPFWFLESLFLWVNP